MVTYFVGLQGSGKSTVAVAVQAGLESRRRRVGYIEAERLAFDFRGDIRRAIESCGDVDDVLIEMYELPAGYTPRDGDIVMHIDRAGAGRRKSAP